MIDPEALINEWTWKTPAMRDMTLAVCRLAIQGGDFSAMDLADHGAESHGGTGIAGSVFGSLAKAEIIEPAGTFGQDGAFYQRRVRNACGNPIGVWRCKNGALARALIRRHAPQTVPTGGVQMELFAGVA